jgi:hypothetical protein
VSVTALATLGAVQSTTALVGVMLLAGIVGVPTVPGAALGVVKLAETDGLLV